MAGPIRDVEGILKGFEAADALAIEDQAEATLEEEAIGEFLGFEAVFQRLLELDDLITRIYVQFLHGQLAFKLDIVRLEVAQVHPQRHKNPF
jgi:hypothetical protein